MEFNQFKTAGFVLEKKCLQLSEPQGDFKQEKMQKTQPISTILAEYVIFSYIFVVI